jgi:bifunctional non-homologous end joining protein LigD
MKARSAGSPQKAAKQPAKRLQHTKRSQSRRSPLKAGDAEVAGVRLSSPDRVVYPDQGLTKLDLAQFYVEIAEWILPHIVDRPLSLVRCPQGRTGQCFYQKHLRESMPDEIHGVMIQEKEGKDEYPVVRDLPGLISLVQMGVLEIHPWPARTDRLDRPDQIVFDLDPGEGTTWKDVIGAAQVIRERLGELSLKSFVRTSGGKGLHVVVPIERRSDWEEMRLFAEGFAERLVADFPDRYVATMSKARRRGKIFVDHFRNRRGATSVASYSTRARAGAPVATPVSWKELPKLQSAAQFQVSNLPSRLLRLKSDPWEGFHTARQSLTRAIMKKLGR